MKFAGKELRKAYYDLLTGEITVLGTVIKCFDTIAPATELTPYIVLSTYNQNGNSNSKSSFGCNATLNLEVVESFDGSAFSRVNVDEISGQILELVRPETISNGLTTTNFDVISVNLQGTIETFLEQDEEQTFRNILIFEHILTEK